MNKIESHKLHYATRGSFGHYYYSDDRRKEADTIKNNIRYLAERSGMSFRKLSVKLGWPKNTLGTIINNYERAPSIMRLECLKVYFELADIDDFLLPEEEFRARYS